MGIFDVSTNLADYIGSDPGMSAGGMDTGGSIGSVFTPDALSAGAESWTDVFKYGISRLVDYKMATVTPQAPTTEAMPTQRTINPQTGSVGQGNGSGLVVMLLLGLLVYKLAG